MYEYVKINEKKRPIKFGFNCLRKFSRITGMGLNEMDKLGDNMTLDTAVTLIWCALEDGARATKEKFTYTIDNLSDELDNDITIIERCMEVFTDQISAKTEKKSQKAQKQK